jgi:hypothetical protein
MNWALDKNLDRKKQIEMSGVISQFRQGGGIAKREKPTTIRMKKKTETRRIYLRRINNKILKRKQKQEESTSKDSTTRFNNSKNLTWNLNNDFRKEKKN